MKRWKRSKMGVHTIRFRIYCVQLDFSYCTQQYQHSQPSCCSVTSRQFPRLVRSRAISMGIKYCRLSDTVDVSVPGGQKCRAASIQRQDWCDCTLVLCYHVLEWCVENPQVFPRFPQVVFVVVLSAEILK